MSKNKTYVVRTRKLLRRFRAGHCFGQEAITVELTPTQAEMVNADPELVCTEMDEPSEPKPDPESVAVQTAQKPKAEAKAK